MYTRKVVFMFLIAALGGFAQAQNLVKTGVLRMQLRNSGPVIQNGQVKGYYFFYNLEKKDKQNNNYLLTVTDENLREINSTDITRPKSYFLADAAYNGQTFGFLFYDTRNKTVDLQAYDATLKEAGMHKEPVKSKLAQAIFAGLATGAQANQALLVPLENKGFLYYGVKEGTRYIYEVTCFDNAMAPQWTSAAPASLTDDVAIASEAFQHEQYVGSLITRKKSARNKDMATDLMVQDLATGKVLFTRAMETKLYSVSFSDVFFDNAQQQFVVFGEYYDKKDKEIKAQAMGFIYLTLDMQGNIVGEKVNSWATELSRVTPVNEKGKFDGSNANLLVHDIIRTADGQIFVVGEQYKKVASGAGIATQILSVAAGAATGYYNTSSSSVQLNIYNMVIFQFNPDYTVNKMHVFEKDKNVVMLPAGSAYTSSKLLSYYAKAVGGFDFIFSQVAADRETFSVAYINYDRVKGEGAKNVLGAIVYTPERVFTTDKMPLKRKSSDYYIYRAKDGYVLVTEYMKKEKRLESRLEKINF